MSSEKKNVFYTMNAFSFSENKNSQFDLINADDLEITNNVYGGRACNKLGVIYNDKSYLLKFPGNLKSRNMKNVILSYSNSPVCEYIGSHIFQMLDVKAHDTLLAKRNGKVVVLCEDFTDLGIVLQEFCDIKVTFEPAFLDENGELTNGDGAKLSEILSVLQQHPFYQKIPNALTSFWEMFIIDAFIGNPDRNNGNWGLLYDQRLKQHSIAPIYDNGNCLNDKWDDDKMLKFLSNAKDFEGIAWKAYRSYQLNDKGERLNPFHVIESGRYSECTKSLLKVLDRIDLGEINAFIDSISILTDTQNRFYKEILKCRYEHLKDLRCGLCI